MKASTLFALTIAALLGLGVAVVAKQMGLFNPETPRVERSTEPEKILVARTNLYADIAISPEMLEVRNLQPGEAAHYSSNKEKYLPPIVAAASLRIPNRHIEAGQPILKEYLDDLAFPEGVPIRLKPGMWAVNIDVPKVRAAGGMITRGDTVDVVLTTDIFDSSTSAYANTQSAIIARNVRIVAKRNILWTVLQAMPEGQPVSFTLEMNPYRATLFQFAQTKGFITLMPVPRPRDLSSTVTAAPGSKVTFAVLDSPEYRDEDQRVDGLLKGEVSVGEGDLERIFRLPVIVRQPPPPPHTIELVSGINPKGSLQFDLKSNRRLGSTDYNDTPPAQNDKPEEDPGQAINSGGQTRLGYVFRMPGSAVEAKAPT